MPEFYSTTEVIYLGRELGRGGEGAVYEVVDKPALVAKIYHDAVSDDKAEKLRQMVRLQNEKLLRLAAWVTDVLRDKPAGKTIGFLMPRINSGRAIHELYSPQSRRQYFPSADWRFLIYAAANLARAFAVVHAHGHAVADVNHGNIVIGRDATVQLIDCDSYHLNAPDRSFLCEVGVSTHTPPELQNKSLREIVRTSNHDAFGLAVLIFQLLFMGRHPFSGNFQGAGENTLENSIEHRRFAYGEDAGARQMKQPPGTLPLRAVSASVANLFERAFLKIENRPTAREWAVALDELGQNLQPCAANTGHYYWQQLKKCPWCKLEGQTGVLFFPAKFTGNFESDGELDLFTLGNLIDAIKPPDLTENLPTVTQHLLIPLQTLPPSPFVTAAMANYRKNLIVFLVVTAVLVFTISHLFGFGSIFWMGFAGYWVISEIFKSIWKTPHEEAQLKVDAARQEWASFKDDWRQIALGKSFETARQGFKSKIKEYQELPLQKDANKIQNELLARRSQLETDLRGSLTGLQQISLQLTKKHEELSVQSNKFAADLSQAESDYQRVSNLKAEAIVWLICVSIISFGIGISMRGLTYFESRSINNSIGFAESKSFDKNNIDSKIKLPLKPIPDLPAVSIKPSESALPWGAKANEFYQIGENHFRQGDYQSAVAAYHNAARANPKIAQIYNKMGEAYFHLALHHKAVETYQKALAIDPTDSDVWHKLGSVHQKTNQLDEAITAFKKAVENNPNAEMSRYELGLLYARRGNRTLAQRQYELLDKANSPFAEKLWRELELSDEAPPKPIINRSIASGS